MTREEASRVLKYLWIERDENAKLMQQLTTQFFERQEALRMGAAALLSPQPDPITGLVPCGCGGKAGFHYSVMLRDNDCYVECGICGGHTRVALSEDRARDAWDTAMGYKGQ